MYRLSFVMAAFAIFVAGTNAVDANDYLVGGMFSTPRVTHFRTVQTGQAFYAPTCCQPACQQPANCCPQTANYPPVAYRQQPVVAYSPVAAAPYQPVVAARPVVVRSKYYRPFQPIRNVARYVLPGVPTAVGYPAAY